MQWEESMGESRTVLEACRIRFMVFSLFSWSIVCRIIKMDFRKQIKVLLKKMQAKISYKEILSTSTGLQL